MTRILAMLFVTICGVGCSALKLQNPTAAVTGMAVRGVDANGFTMNFDVQLQNPNSVALPLAGADYKLALSGTDVVQGKASPSGSIPANGSTTVTLPVMLTYENLLTAEQGIVKSGGDVPYAFDGGLSFDTGTPIIGVLHVPVRYSGTLPLRDVLNNPQALLQNPAAQRLAKQLVGELFRR